MRFVECVAALLVLAAGAVSAQPSLSPFPLPGAARTSAPGPQRLIDVIDLDEHESQVDITVQFNCSLRYAGHSPASEGSELRLRLRPERDCGIAGSSGLDIATEIPPISGPAGIITSARVETALGAEVALTLTFARPESFVLAQGASAAGMRIRLLRVHDEKARILVTERGDTASNYAVNLESRREPFPPGALELAAKRLQTTTFMSEIETAGEKWYRLRAGPFDQRTVAENVLRAATKDYPRAWLAVGDDSITNDPNAAVSEPALPAVEQAGTDPALSPAERQDLLQAGRRALRSRDYAAAAQIFTKLQRQPEFPERADVQELLGLARERAGEVAQAKAEYEEYLHRYPQGAAAERIRARLRILRAASLGTGADARTGEQAERGWKVSGGASQLYRRDSYGTDFNGPLYSKIVQNAIFTDADLFVHHDGERFAEGFRTNVGYARNLLPRDIPGALDRVHVTTAFLDLSDKLIGARGRLGRQTSFADGVFGTYDGASASYRFAPSWLVRGAVGLPVEDTADAPRHERRFESLAIGYAPALSHWDASLYATEQSNDGLRDRQAVGGQVQYASAGATVVSYVDYDTVFRSLNALAILGAVHLPGRWQVTLDLEHRNAPLITAENALIGQPVTSIGQLEQLYGREQIAALARDRTAVLSTYSASALKQLGERFQALFDVSCSRLSSTPASAGVEAFTGTDGNDISYQVQLMGESLLRSYDFNQIILRYDTTPTYKAMGWQLISRYPLFGAWRIGPRMLFQRKSTDTGYTSIFYAPYAHLDYQRRGHVLEMEAGAELGKNPAGLEIGNTTRLFVSIGYRINF